MNIMSQTEYLEISEKTNVVSVIGADTYLGSHMVEHLYQNGKSVLGFRDSDEFDFSQKQIFQKEKKKLSYPAAAIISESIYLCYEPDIGFEKYTVKIRKFCDSCLKNGFVGNVCFFSCGTAYLSGIEEITEEGVIAPQTERDLALVTGENILNVMLYNKSNYASPIIFRLGIPYGNELNTTEGYGFVNLFCSLAMRHNEFEVPFLSDVKRTLTYIGDMCDAAIAITENANSPLIVNIPGEILTIGEIASAISKHYGVSFKAKGCFSPDDYCFDAGDLILSDKYFNENAEYTRKISFANWLSAQKTTI